MYCDCFILPLLLPIPTIWFSLDHMWNVSDGNVLILLTPIPSRLWLNLRLWFLIFTTVISPLTTPLTTPTPTPSLVKTSLKKASAVDPENWVGLLIDRASRKICFSQSKALPRSGQWHNWHQYEISAAFIPHWRHFAGKPVVASRNVMTVFSGCINWNYYWVVSMFLV